MRFLFLLFITIVGFSTFAQVPFLLSHQSALRDGQGNVISNQNVVLRFTLRNGQVDGEMEWQELHEVSTNLLGLVNVTLGSLVSLENVVWNNGDKFLQVELLSENGFLNLGTQQLLSVPYALFAKNVDVRVSDAGDSLFIGGNSVIVPGISDANENVNPYAHTCGSDVFCFSMPGLVSGNFHNPDLDYGVLEDQEGNTYKTIVIGEQEWMAENLKTSVYRNGESIIHGISDYSSMTLEAGAWRYINCDSNYECPYGKYYNWYACTDERGLCPSGWHVPDTSDFHELIASVGNDGSALLSNRCNLFSSNTSGFSGLVGGTLMTFVDLLYDLSFVLRGTSSDGAYATNLFTPGGDYIALSSYPKNEHYGVRCVKNREELNIVYGCMDVEACNYNPLANFSNGECSFPGRSCNDGNELSFGDVYNADCSCEGQLPFPHIASSCGADDVLSSNHTYGQLQDQDGNVYKTIVIGNQEWMAENLKVESYRNGDLLESEIPADQWFNTSVGAWCYYEDNPIYECPYGKLYNWYAVTDSRSLCPSGWRVPSTSDWHMLASNLGSDFFEIPYSGGSFYSNLGGKLKTANLNWWQGPNSGSDNSTGFSAIPGGARLPYLRGGCTAGFNHLGYEAFFWKIEELDYLYFNNLNLSSFSSNLASYSWYNLTVTPQGSAAFSVRCIRE
jgi:uncharacterized protein (TIGR02145 family)